MNGEPREEALGASDQSRAPRQASVAHEGEQPLLPAIDTDGLTQTSRTKEDASLAPLFTPDAALDFRSRWDLVQRSFVDDPKEAVHAADELVAQVTENLAQTFAKHRSALEKGLDQAERPTTENLRLALRQYRSFFERLLSI
ncbi:MAG TPA: hypothetical protein VHW95_08415 [Steroidobacteraceae bacterium]|jgi:hypothetical protein|nr:hypothetical protein [Steroidobacteraceae bacterium]